MTNQQYDQLLNIKTVGNQKGFHKSLHYHRYEPTPYQGLEQLFQSYELRSGDRVVDFGCGKGRLNFYIYHLFNVDVVGIEMDEIFYQDAMENRGDYIKKYKNGSEKIHFQCCMAQDYEIKPNDNRFYFFNPFSLQVFIQVVNRILLSVEIMEREVDLILYYPSEDYIYFLENQTAFEMIQEVKLKGKYEHNSNERFLIYRLRHW
ncbi:MULTISPECIES: methyltransferase domain-containing protein [unclassified Bacillus (in: firmicutes)]|uniref:methyltransferase domain-containing protein n=1 Tax=unclassified Bacillus (in: firmicutes) TaxID=185979 RepID=UPI0008EE6037|nr:MULTISPECIES: methyltransferase domain-containing protein [unclassified Bacillus (in: firmicutes)]SFB06541.1 Methyltransferase domain-containing protein [Bacillus sp. UNCCL13]SFQ87648.1 Methyltransferase domain-containing protein [Bacillus sp. cl95]